LIASDLQLLTSAMYRRMYREIRRHTPYPGPIPDTK
jgi:hypothetical protein